MRRVTLIFTVFWILCQSTLAVSPQKISIPLQEELSTSHPASMLSVIIHLHAQADIAGMDQELYEAKVSRAFRHETVIVALRRVAEESQGPILVALEGLVEIGEVEGFTPFWITNCIVVKATRRTLEEISDRDDIKWLEQNFHTELIEPVPSGSSWRREHLDDNHGVPRGIRAIEAPRVWYELGYTGAGRLVANLDTGVDGTHPALASRWRGLFAPMNECWYDPIYGNAFPRDLNSHGTHVMGTICGNSEITNDSIGVAPEALWIASNAIDQNVGPQIDNDILAAFQWFADPDEDPYTIEDVPDVVQNSWGVDHRFPGYEDCFEFWNNAIINCEAAGVVVTFSAGNEGPSSRTLRSPATVAIDSVTMFSIGAVDATNDTVPPYGIAGFSSRGPSDCPPQTAIKPEVCAPGVDVYSSVPGGDYEQEHCSGTSMAGPHVAGIVALMRQACPDAEVRDIKSILMRTAHDYGSSGEDNTYGFGFVDAYEAVMQITANRGFVEGVVRDDDTNDPIQDAIVKVAETGHSIRTNVDGYYRISMLADSIWTLHYSAFGYYAQTFDMSLSAGDTVTQDVYLEVAPYGTLEGRVVAGDSVPVVGATVSFPGTPAPSQVTDSLGEFEIQMPGDTSYDVQASFQDAIQDTNFFIVSGGVTEAVLFLNSPRSQPAGPDDYGYFSFDRLDFGNPASFDWVEIAPMAGGDGTTINLPARDSSGFVAMPFPLYFYGQAFDSLTANENGWLSPGISHDHTFFNFMIPGRQGPSGTLAPFWDNLHDGAESEICYFYDSLNCRFIIEYYNMQYLPPGQPHVTFQVQIYSSEHRVTPTGDCEIVYLYQQIDFAGGSTIGLEDPTETIGLQLVFNGAHEQHTWLIGADAAVRLTTRTQPSSEGSLTGQIIAHPEVADISEAVIQVGCREIHPDETGSFQIDSLATGLHRPEVLLAGYENGRTEVIIGADSTSQVTLEIWRLDSPRELEAMVVDTNVTLQWRPPVSIEGGVHLDAFQYYGVYRNDSLIAMPEDTIYEDVLPDTGLYDYYVVAEYEGGTSDSSNHVQVEATSSVEESALNLPEHFELSPCYPNPFNATTVITFALPRASDIQITVFDILGRQTAQLTGGAYPAGWHRITWKADGAATGLYFVKMEANDFRQVRKVFLLR